MKTIKLTLVLVIVLLSVIALQGCGSSGSGPSDPPPAPPPPPAVTIQKVNGTYYRVDVDMSAVSHYEFGRQFALQIKNTVPDFELFVNLSIQATITMLQEYDPDMDFDELSARAHAIYNNMPEEYQQEIQGMQSVFSSTDDEDYDQLSRNKLLVYELAPDVARLISCSASAAFGSGTTTGKTIVGRNLEWNDNTRPFLSRLHEVVVLHNGSKSCVFFAFVGQLYPISGFNTNKLFVATLDSDTGLPYPDDDDMADKRSYVMDLRYALENQATIQGIADYLTGKKYAYNFNIFLADENTAAVFEDNTVTATPLSPPFSGLRTATSLLKTPPIPAWNFSNAIACVNWFTLPGTYDNSSFWSGNLTRWNSFINLYSSAFANGGKVDMDIMKQIMGYPGPTNTGKAVPDGAIWRYNEGDSEMQSIIMNMETLETWVSFQPEGVALKNPNYIQVFAGNPF
jgi:hypothetical protein